MAPSMAPPSTVPFSSISDDPRRKPKTPCRHFHPAHHHRCVLRRVSDQARRRQELAKTAGGKQVPLEEPNPPREIHKLLQELSEHLGIRLLNECLSDPTMHDCFESIFPKDNPKNTRFSINFFTSIGLDGITENLLKNLKNMPRRIMQQQKPVSESEGFGSSGSSDSDASTAESDSVSSSSDDESDRDGRRGNRRRR
ncbi:hypothetical protein U1Q18_044124 [Sarracenia purpurea var. burkii]